MDAVRSFVATLGKGSKILDVGCGDGVPITQYLVSQGFQVFALDSSQTMMERFQINFPLIPFQCAPIQESDLFNETFEAVIAWGVFFHLTEMDQRTAIDRIAHSLKTRGRFLFTSGKEAGRRSGQMHGVTFHYLSLGSELYAQILKEHELVLTREFHDSSENYYYESEKRPRGF
ncbi:MAG: class I SAM-dependent methyltransferase [Spirochaetia bacterium]|nr:class I SAM-dependent methyltransferase [Spirochaetia bacterium]